MPAPLNSPVEKLLRVGGGQRLRMAVRGRVALVAMRMSSSMSSNGAWESDKPWHFVRDVVGAEWHIAAEFGYLPVHQSWTLCGRWPTQRSGWKDHTTDETCVAIHDTCRFWARIGGPWLYVRTSSSNVYHVVLGRAEETTRASALCGEAPDPAWTVLVDRPIALALHDACRVQRDLFDLETRQSQLEASPSKPTPRSR